MKILRSSCHFRRPRQAGFGAPLHAFLLPVPRQGPRRWAVGERRRCRGGGETEGGGNATWTPRQPQIRRPHQPLVAGAAVCEPWDGGGVHVGGEDGVPAHPSPGEHEERHGRAVLARDVMGIYLSTLLVYMLHDYTKEEEGLTAGQHQQGKEQQNHYR